MGFCLSADAVTAVYVNEKLAWSGNSTQQEDILINQPDLFGGMKKEGGLVGYMVHLPGKADQVMPANLTARWNLTPETSPAYRGITSLMFVGGGPVSRGQTTSAKNFFDVIGQVAADAKALKDQGAEGTGFSWSWNNPILAQTVWARLRRAPGNGPGSSQILHADKAMIGIDANPAHMVAECLTNTVWGMGAPVSTINIDSFNAAGDALFAEQFGLSMKWTRQAKIEDFVGEILDHIQATVFLNPRSGQWEIKLLRDDYDVGSLRQINPDNAKLTNFQRRLWGEAGNQVAVTFTDPLTEEDTTVTAEDLGAINSQGGSPVTISRNYYGVRNRDLALRLAQRDVRSSSAPLASATAEVDRHFWDLAPGEVLLLTWPEKGIYNLVVRPLSVDRGNPESGTIKLSLLEDIFALEKPPLMATQEPGWVDPGQPPEPIEASEVFTLPYYFTASADFQTAAVDLVYPEALAGVLAYQGNPDTRSYTLVSAGVDPSGAPIYDAHGAKSIVERAVLPAGKPWETETRLEDILVLNHVRGPRVGGFAMIGAGNERLMEIAQVKSFDEVTREWVLDRGVLDTVPRAWPPGTPVWFLNKGLNITDEVELRSEGETVEFKLLPRTSRGVLPLEDADTISDVMSGRPHLPLRPANVKVNGTAAGSLNGGAAATLLVSWSTRNRQLEDAQVVRWTAGPVAPEYEQGTVVTVYDQDGNNVYEQWGLWTESELALTRSWFDRYASITIVVSSRRRDLDSLQGHAIAVTGLANNPAASPPPAPFVPGPPPSPEAAPAAGAWSASGTAFTLTEAGKVVSAVPGIVVSGARDRDTAAGLIVRYKKVGSADWFYLAEVTLSDLPTQSSTTSVVAKTTYVVEVAYRGVTNILSGWRSLGEVTTGALIADGIGDLTGQQIRDALEFLGEIGDAEKEALAHVGELIANTQFNAEAILSQFLVNVEDKSRFEALMHMPDGQEVATFAANEREERVSDSEAFAFNFNLLGAKRLDQSAFILNGQTVWLTDTLSLAQYRQSITAEFGTVNGLIETKYNLALTATSAVATELHTLGVMNSAGNAFVINENTARFSSNGQTVAQRFSSVSADIGTARAQAISSAQAYVDSSSAFAQVLSSLGVSVGTFTSTITTLSQTSNAYGAKYGLRLDVNGHVTGFTAMNNGSTGGFVFVGDYFAITTPAGDKRPFAVLPDGTVLMQNVKIDGNLFVDGTITGNKIVGGAVSNLLSYELGSGQMVGGGETTDISFVYGSDGGKHDIAVYGDVGTTTSSQAGAIVRLYCDGVVVGDGAVFVPGSWGRQGCSFPVAHTPGPGAHTYSLSYEKTPGSGALRINKSYVKITELKK